MAKERDRLALKHLEAIIADDIPGYETKFKDQSKLHRGFGKLIKSWLRMTITLFPKVWFKSDLRHKEDPKAAMRTLQHEWVHLKDAYTLFDKMPRMLKWLNVITWYKLYLMPQLLAILAIVAPVAVLLGAPATYWTFLLFLLFAAPIPAYFRMVSELRGYRRTHELGGKPEDIVNAFVGPGYYFMSPFRNYILKRLVEPSPYAEEMDQAIVQAYELADAELDGR